MVKHYFYSLACALNDFVISLCFTLAAPCLHPCSWNWQLKKLIITTKLNLLFLFVTTNLMLPVVRPYFSSSLYSFSPKLLFYIFPSCLEISQTFSLIHTLRYDLVSYPTGKIKQFKEGFLRLPPPNPLGHQHLYHMLCLLDCLNRWTVCAPITSQSCPCTLNLSLPLYSITSHPQFCTPLFFSINIPPLCWISFISIQTCCLILKRKPHGGHVFPTSYHVLSLLFSGFSNKPTRAYQIEWLEQKPYWSGFKGEGEKRNLKR